MYSRLWQEQNGAVTAVWVALLGFVLLLGVATVEREWVNYKLRLVEEALDIAAEAGGQVHEVSATLKVVKRQWWEEEVAVCVTVGAEGECLELGTELVTKGPIYEYPTITGLQRELEGDQWKAPANCGSDPWRPNWQCVSVEIVDRWLTYLPPSQVIALETLQGNWENQKGARVVGTEFRQWTLQQGVDPAGVTQVTAHLQLRPVFGLLPWSYTRSVTGTAVTKVRALQLDL